MVHTVTASAMHARPGLHRGLPIPGSPVIPLA